MSTENLLNQAVKGALAFGAAGSLVGAGAALAQTAAPASATAPAGTNLSTITVTGSHIPQTAIATAQPVVSISREQIEATGFTTVGQLLNNLSQTGTALNTQFNNGGNGSVFVNLHHLGSNRTLVLVDGQRWSTGIGNSVDLTTIPLGIVDHVDVLLDGASAIYGSEAIAGVVNIITVKNFNGAEASAYMGIYDASHDGGGWDGKTQQYSLLIGTSNDRSSVLFGAGFFQRNEIRAGNRDISKEPVNGGGPAFGSAGSPLGLFITLPTGAPTFPNACIGQSPGGHFTDYCFMGGPFTGSGPAQPLSYTPYNFAPLSYIRTPAERWYLYSQGHYDLTDNVSFHFRGAYNNRQSDQLLAANPWYFGAGGTLLANGMTLGISGNAGFNPFGHDLVPAYYTSTGSGATWCSLYGSAGGACGANWATLALAGFRPTSKKLRDFRQTNQTYFFNGGFSGFWMMAGNQWTWNADYIYSRTTSRITTTGLHNTARMQKALGPASKCVGAPDGCTPLNIFGAQAGLTNDMMDYIGFTAHSANQTIIRDYNANIGGGFFNGWYAGPWGAAVGYEYYEQDGFFQPDAIISAGNTDGNVAQPTSGKIKTNAQYVELRIPFAHNLPGAKELSVDLAERWSQFKWSGQGNVIQGSNVVVQPTTGSSNSQTGRVALKYRPVSQLLLRASWSQGFRAPSISELFSGKADSYLGIKDPCAPGPNGAWDGNPAHLPANCPAGAVQPTSQILTSLGGNANLTPEQAISKSVGFVYSPNWAPGLDFNADYYHVEVVNNIGVVGAQRILNNCYPQSGTPTMCNLVLRPGNIVRRVINFNVNIGSQTISGYDVGLTYRFPTTPVGNFTLRANGDWVKSDVGCIGNGMCFESSGTLFSSGFGGEPKHRYQLGLDWDFGAWSANWTTYVIGQMWEDCASGALGGNPDNCSNPEKSVGPGNYVNPDGQNHIGTTVYHDVQASYTVASWNTTFTLGVQNLFDKVPPIARNAFQNGYIAAYYRTPGRFIYGRISVNF